jgi:hypothetical protein
MKKVETPLVVMPPVYEMPMNFWKWCRLSEVCEVASQLAAISCSDYKPTPENLVSRFAALTKFITFPGDKPYIGKSGRRKKLFRYTLDGKSIKATEVPVRILTIDPPAPPFMDFYLGVGKPYPDELYVPEGWAQDTLKSVKAGYIAVENWKDETIGGYSPKEELRNVVHLSGRKLHPISCSPSSLKKLY